MSLPKLNRGMKPAILLPGLRGALQSLVFVLLLFMPPDVIKPNSHSETRADRVLLEIGPAKTTVGEFLLYLRQINPIMDFANLPASEQQDWLEEFTNKKLFALRAQEAKLDKMPEVRARIEFFVDSVLAQELKDKVLHEIHVTEEELQAYYQNHKEEFKQPSRVLLQHFLYKSSEMATRAQARLAEGASHASLQEDKKTESDLLLVERKWFTPALLISELAEVAFQLPVGKVSDVVQSSYGYHVLRVEDKEPSQYKDPGAARGEILDKIRQSRATRLYQEILDGAKRRHPVRVHLDRVQR